MKKIFITLLIIFIGSFVCADEGVQKFILDNGQTVVIKEVHTNPIVTMDTWIKTGSINEDDSNNGVSHFLEHLFFRGSKNHAPGEFDKLLETKGAITNAATSKDFTHYYITIPSKYFGEALELHADMLLNPLLPENELEQERKVVLEEIAKDDNSPQKVVYDNLVSMIYSEHPYKRKVIGKSDIIETISRENIMNYYNRWYVPSNMVTVIVGDINTSDALAKVKKEFSGIRRKSPKAAYPKEKQLSLMKQKTEYMDAQSGYMLIGFRGVNISSRDSYALDVLAAILGEGRSSVFYKNIKDNLRLAFSISAFNSGFRDDGIFYVSAKYEPEKLEKLKSQIFKEIEDIRQNGVTASQVSLAQNMIEKDTYYQRESVSNIAQEIGYVMVTSDDMKIYDNYVDNIKKVTPQEVKRAAQKYLGKDMAAISVVLPEKSKELKISDKTEFSGNAVLKKSTQSTQKYVLSNGSTLILTPNNSNKIIAVSIYVKGGNFVEQKYGTSNLAASLMLKGTQNYSAQELAEVMENNGIEISPSAGSDAFVITALTTEPQYEKTLALLSEVVNNAIFPDNEIEKVKKEKLQLIRQSRDLPINVAAENYKHLIYSGTPYVNSSILLEKNIPSITKEEIINYYNKIFVPKNIVVSINGNADKDMSVKYFSNMFKSEGCQVFQYKNYENKFTEIKTPLESIKTIPSTNTDWIFLAWRTAGLNDKKDYATLKIIDYLLGTGMSSRLFKNLRDNEGLAYQLGSGYSAKLLSGAFVVYIGTNPDTYGKALEGLRREINVLKTEFVGAQELQEAKDKLAGNYILSLETNMDKASTYGWYETAFGDYDFTDEYLELINSVTASDIIRVANKYFKENSYVLSVVKNKSN